VVSSFIYQCCIRRIKSLLTARNSLSLSSEKASRGFLSYRLKYPQLEDIMADTELKPLPLGTSDFFALRNNGQIYVDKTALIYELASKRQKFFLARPRRFGKSLLVSTFESLFKYGLRDFKGLAIEKLWKDEQVYQVVRLDFSEIKNFDSLEDFSLSLTSLLARRFSPLGFVYKESNLYSVTDQLSDWLLAQPQSSLVLLIDEYDAPLTACLSDADLFNSVRRKLSKFYGIVKSNDAAFQFFFMTGITKFSKASIFSELNNLSDISLTSEYGSLLGYTYEELKQYFDSYLNRAAKVLNLSKENLVSELTKNYDGFCFEKTAKQHLFAPWSLLKFLGCPSNGFENYWYESAGNPTALQQYLKSHSLREPEDYFKPKFVPIPLLQATATDVEHINDLALLTQAGYLTIKEVGTDSFLVGYPNKEVADSLAWLYREKLLSSQSIDQLGAMHLRSDLQEGNVDSVVGQINKLFLATDYTKYPVNDEITCRNYMQLFLTLGAYVRTYAELHNALGRSDLELETSRLHWVFEIKFLKNENRENEHQITEAERLLNTAVAQIKERHYGETDFSGKKLIRVALVFSEKERQFVCWSKEGI